MIMFPLRLSLTAPGRPFCSISPPWLASCTLLPEIQGQYYFATAATAVLGSKTAQTSSIPLSDVHYGIMSSSNVCLRNSRLTPDKTLPN